MTNYDPHEEGNGTGGWITPPRRVRGNARRALAVPLGCVCTPLGAGGGDARPAVVARRNAATRGPAHLAEAATGGRGRGGGATTDIVSRHRHRGIVIASRVTDRASPSTGRTSEPRDRGGVLKPTGWALVFELTLV